VVWAVAAVVSAAARREAEENFEIIILPV
jgi:hypothetical protein